MRINQKVKKRRKKARKCYPESSGFKKYLDVFGHRRLFELLGRLATVVLYKIVDNALFEAQFDGNVFTEDHFAFKNVLIGKHEFNA